MFRYGPSDTDNIGGCGAVVGSGQHCSTEELRAPLLASGRLGRRCNGPHLLKESLAIGKKEAPEKGASYIGKPGIRWARKLLPIFSRLFDW